jgi:predicted PurR-regulated permease PerM
MKGKISFKVVVIIAAFIVILIVAFFFLSEGKKFAEEFMKLFWDAIKGGGNQGS